MSRLSKNISGLMPNCREAIRLQSDALDQPLSLWQRAGLRLHLMLCKWCRRYGRQIALLRIVAKNCEEVHGTRQNLPIEARARIKQALKTGQNSPE